MSAPPLAMVPTPARVSEVRRELADVVTLRLEVEGRPFQPGQFNMLYAFGVGEIPISISGPPERPAQHLHTIRAVGAVSRALCAAPLGAQLGVRGPFGAPWPLAEAEGQDLVLIAGGLGLAPLRPVVYAVLAERTRYGRVTLLVGARSPCDLLFAAELAAWERQGALDVLAAVDRVLPDEGCPPWSGRVGVVTSLLTELALAPERALALVCGPEVMMGFAWRELSRRGLPDERIYLSMERNMKCALGFCGHCQLGASFLCKDGPVLRADRLRRVFWQREA